MNPLGVLLRVLGIGALVAGGLVVAVAAVAAAIVFAPLLFWIAWNVLDFGRALGLHGLGFWAIVLATLFLIGGWFIKVVITGIVFLIDPGWLHKAAQMHWPAPIFRNFVAIVLLALLASRPHAHAHKHKHKRRDKRSDATVVPTNET